MRTAVRQSSSFATVGLTSYCCRAAALTLFLALTGCASIPPLPPDLSLAHELERVPFYPQADYQCGPAALATVLQASGVSVSPEELVPRVYLPGRKGSLQTELIAAARQYERLPYVISKDFGELLAQVERGLPVLVLQNLGLRNWPHWHFAVVIGFDVERGEVILRSGTDRRREMSFRSFVLTWDRANRWGMVTLRLDEMPARADPERYLTAAAGLEAVTKLDAARISYETARSAWPDSPWPYLGLANVAYLNHRLGDARALYEQVIVRDTNNVSARFNLGDTLARQGCIAAARHQMEQALHLAGDAHVRARIAARMAQLEPNSSPASTAECPVYE